MIGEKRRQLQKRILDAMGPIKFRMPSEPIRNNEYHLKLHPLQIEHATSAFTSTLLIAGSTPTPVGEIDLFELLNKYLLLPDFRIAVNALMDQYPLMKEHIKVYIEEI